MPEIQLGNVVGPHFTPSVSTDGNLSWTNNGDLPNPATVNVKGPKGDTGTFSPEDLQRISSLESGKVDKVSGKSLSTNDYTDADKNAVATIGDKVDKVSGKGLSTNDYTDADKAKVAAALTQHQDISGKVDKVSGKGLSTNDYTNADKNKLSGIPADANHTTIDTTLTNAGQAADAKTAGDMLSALRSLISRMDIDCKASGNPATFFDADAANIKDLRVTLTPAQSGSGDPYPPGGGKNLFSASPSGAVAANLTNDNGVITLTKRVASESYVSLGSYALAPGSYILNGGYSAGFRVYLTVGGVLYISQGGDTAAFSSDSAITGTLGCTIGPNIPVGAVIRPMIRLASDADPTFAPYSNVRPISGVSSVTVTRTGTGGANSQSVTVSLVDSNSNPLTVYGGTLDVTTGVLTVTNAHYRFDGSESWGLSTNNPNNNLAWIYCRGLATFPLSEEYIDQSTPPICSEYKYVPGDSLWRGSLTGFGMQRPVGTNYYEIFITDTRFGKSATLADWQTRLAESPLDLVYPLATPLTYQLTPQQLATLSGYNAVSANAGSVSVTYKADTSIIFGGG